MTQIMVPLIFIPVFGSEKIVWLLASLIAIFAIDRKLDGRYGVLVPIEAEEETKANPKVMRGKRR